MNFKISLSLAAAVALCATAAAAEFEFGGTTLSLGYVDDSDSDTALTALESETVLKFGRFGTQIDLKARKFEGNDAGLTATAHLFYEVAPDTYVGAFYSTSELNTDNPFFPEQRFDITGVEAASDFNNIELDAYYSTMKRASDDQDYTQFGAQAKYNITEKFNAGVYFDRWDLDHDTFIYTADNYGLIGGYNINETMEVNVVIGNLNTTTGMGETDATQVGIQFEMNLGGDGAVFDFGRQY